MKKLININFLFLLILAVSFASCKKEYGNLNSPTVEDYLDNASIDQLNNLVSGTESAMRNNLGLYLDDIGVLGREMYRFSGADPRYVTDLLGGGNSTLSNSGFYITNVWSSRYRVVKNCNVLEEAAANSTYISEAEKKGYSGFAKTIKAYQLLLVLNLTSKNGIRVDVADPKNLGPILNETDALTAIATLLDEANTELASAQVDFPLSDGFEGFKDAAGLAKFNRALAARVAVYRKQWSAALSALEGSFYSLDGDFNTGVYDVFGTGSGDQLNSAFFPQNQAGEVRLAHPSYATEIEASDDRIGKASMRTAPTSSSGLTSDRDVWVYTSSTAPVPIIRNEELILIYAEANIQLGGAGLNNAVSALNKIRTKHNLGVYSGAVTQSDLVTEMLKQRRYSLFFEGHRWIDMRRYDLLSTLPIDRPEDDIWSEFPIPNTEQ
ncbi:RagB/SusD family nutrient uptake outer membrane protein [Flavihumibacter profundi]|jgi:starch-binding outer membrane protein, SusD/RagB family|uniref:RagB/SusD family nutrient uptake outer membrane protein n=1 Tax=Flavihumibacter profundi TaxID=2716883 RepID=UPI001CC7FDE3|nr:RagB/SusD family nutrient uptake outer membrane protein [Flavihumibacter profundi]MBZ5855924.1 RagB/SusD family nutrient uptake outer membrane protein [Flavihumibacter profundi]